MPAMSGMPLGRNFWRLWGASGMTNLADGILTVALPLLAAQLTRSPVLVAMVTLAHRLPWLVFALPAGAFADRLDRRRTMRNVQFLRVACIGALTLAVLADLASIPLLCAVALALGVGETLYDTAAQSILPMIVVPEQLSRANGRLLAVEWVANQFVGPPLAGLLAGVAGLGMAPPLGATTALFGLAAALLMTLHGAFRAARPGGPARLRDDIAEGVRYLFGHPLLRTLAFMTGMMNLTGTAVLSVLVLYAVGPGSAMGLSGFGYGVLTGAGGVGAVLGSLLAPHTERWLGRSTVLLLAVVASAAAPATIALTADPVLVGVAFVAMSATGTQWNVITVSLRQRITPQHLLGRMNAGYRLLAWGSMPLGSALGGAVGEASGLRAVFAGSATVVLALLALAPLISPARIAAAEGGRPAAGEAGA